MAGTRKKLTDKNLKTPTSEKNNSPHPLELLSPISKDGRNTPLVVQIERASLRKRIVLDEEAELDLQMIEKEYAGRARLADCNLPYSRNILLYGRPGCGKTSSAGRLAWNLGLPMFKMNVDAVLSSYLGESLKNLRQVFEAASQESCLLFIDEADSIGSSRDINETGEIRRVLTMLLELIEAYSPPDGMVVMATNIEGKLDPALWRRFDKIIQIQEPRSQQITQIIESVVVATGLPTLATINWGEISPLLVGISAAHVVRFIQDIAKRKVLDKSYIVDQQTVELAIVKYRQSIGK